MLKIQHGGYVSPCCIYMSIMDMSTKLEDDSY